MSDININDPAVQKRLAAQWGYVPAHQQYEPIKDEREAFREWFESVQGDAFDGMWSFAKAAWTARAALGARPKPDCGEAGHDDGRCGNRQCLPGAQPTTSVKDDIIDDLQSQFDTEGITEHDSGDALIRLSNAIAAVEDNFAQPAPSVSEGWKLVPTDPTAVMITAALESSDVLNVRRVMAVYDAMLAAAPKMEEQ